jgi:hypothetical protein
MAGMFEEITREAEKRKLPCKFTVVREQLTPEDQAGLDSAMSSDVTTSAIHRVLKKRDLFVSEHVIMRHRRAECTCVDL